MSYSSTPAYLRVGHVGIRLCPVSSIESYKGRHSSLMQLSSILDFEYWKIIYIEY